MVLSQLQSRDRRNSDHHHHRRVVRVDRCAAPWPLAISDLHSGIAVGRWHPPGSCWCSLFSRHCEGGPVVFSRWPLAFYLRRYPSSDAEHHVLVFQGPGVQHVDSTSIYQVSVADTSCGKPPVSCRQQILDICWWNQHVARLDPGIPAHDALHLMVDTYEGRKTMASWRRPPGRPCNVWLNKVQEDANALPLSTLWRSESEIARGHWAAQQSTRTTRKWWW